jgi:hypothetical protein
MQLVIAAGADIYVEPWRIGGNLDYDDDDECSPVLDYMLPSLLLSQKTHKL